MKSKLLLTIVLCVFSLIGHASSQSDLYGTTSRISSCDPLISYIDSVTKLECDQHYDSRMAEVKIRIIHTAYRYIWKKAKRKDKQSRYNNMISGQFDDKETTKSKLKYVLKNADYRLKANRNKVIIKVNFKY